MAGIKKLADESASFYQHKIFSVILFFLLLGHSRADVELTQLLVVNQAGCLAHDIGSTLVLREGDDIADRFPLGHQHHQTVKAEGQTTVGRRAILESVHHEAKLGVSLFLGQAQSLEDLLLQVGVVEICDVVSGAEYQTLCGAVLRLLLLALIENQDGADRIVTSATQMADYILKEVRQ